MILQNNRYNWNEMGDVVTSGDFSQYERRDRRSRDLYTEGLMNLNFFYCLSKLRIIPSIE